LIYNNKRYWGRYPFLIGILFILGLNIYAAGFLSSIVGSIKPQQIKTTIVVFKG
jgi:hypothetical protein